VSCVSHGYHRPMDSRVSRLVTNGERWMLLLCGLERRGWLKSFQLLHKVNPPPFFCDQVVGRKEVGGGYVMSVTDSGDCVVKSRN
jgi:hypothetical protein